MIGARFIGECRSLQLDIGDDATVELEGETPLRDRFAALRVAAPSPAPTGEVADTSFFDALSDLVERTLSRSSRTCSRLKD